jgi:RimJ/RimL family protein N-acetyltransferase
MRHSLKLEGYGLRLRPVELEDAEFIVWLRNLEHARGMLGDTTMDIARQEEWLETYFERDKDYYFLVETAAGLPVGTHGLYNFQGASAESGRFVTRPDVPAALPTSVLTFDLVFKQMGLKELRATSVAGNRKLHSYIRKFGCRLVRTELAGRIINGQPVDILHFVQSAEDWFGVRERFISLAEFAGRQIRDWERAQLEQRKAR